MVAVTGRTCYDRIRIFEVKRYFLIDITESRGQIMQKNYVQEILNIIHGNIPQAELAENCRITMKKIWRMFWKRSCLQNASRFIPFWE